MRCLTSVAAPQLVTFVCESGVLRSCGLVDASDPIGPSNKDDERLLRGKVVCHGPTFYHRITAGQAGVSPPELNLRALLALRHWIHPPFGSHGPKFRRCDSLRGFRSSSLIDVILTTSLPLKPTDRLIIHHSHSFLDTHDFISILGESIHRAISQNVLRQVQLERNPARALGTCDGRD